MNRSLTIAVILYVVIASLSVMWVYKNALKSEFIATVDAGNIRLSEATARLQGQFETLRILANLIAEDRLLAKTLAEKTDDNVDEYLKRYSLKYGLWRIDLTDRIGNTIATSDPRSSVQVSNKPLADAGINGRLGYQIWYDKEHRLVQFSKGVLSSANKVVGTVIVMVDLANLEFEWPVTPEPYVFFTEHGVSVSSNRPDLLFLDRRSLAENDNYPFEYKGAEARHDLWTYRISPARSQEVMLVERRIDPLKMDAQIVLDTHIARSTAQLQMWLAIALFVMIFLAALIAYQQRKRLAIETRHSATLETRVQARTAELRAAQDKLVAASQLAAMGRLSAGLSHELNQPLTAIMNFSQNGKRFLEETKQNKAGQNFEMISDQVRRMTRIISGLRAFAREEAIPTETVDLRAITVEALELAENDLKTNEIDLNVSLPDGKTLVEGGRVRLQQVILNLVSNAIDAMQNSVTKRLFVSLSIDAGIATLSFQDTGEGVKDIEHVFEPFYTTKELGASKGLGMGLALSYGIINRFGGELICNNTDEGAEFSIVLPISKRDA